jgi:cytidylate kinase
VTGPRVVTVAATYGAGGTLIAPRLATRLGLPFADRLAASARPPSPVPDSPSPVLDGLTLLSAGLNIPVPRDPEELPEQLRAHVAESVHALLEAGGAVILGRAAALVLGRRPGAYHVRLDGPADRRARRGAAREGVDLATAEAHLADSDKLRARSIRRLYEHDPADPSLYHLVLDTTVLTVDDSVSLLAAAAEAFWSEEDNPTFLQ